MWWGSSQLWCCEGRFWRRCDSCPLRLLLLRLLRLPHGGHIRFQHLRPPCEALLLRSRSPKRRRDGAPVLSAVHGDGRPQQRVFLSGPIGMVGCGGGGGGGIHEIGGTLGGKIVCCIRRQLATLSLTQLLSLGLQRAGWKVRRSGLLGCGPTRRWSSGLLHESIEARCR